MFFYTRLESSHKINSIYMFDLLIIYKLIEKYTNERLEDSTQYYHSLSPDYISYDEVFYPLGFFLEKTGIGECTSEVEVFYFTIYSLRDVLERDDLPKEKKKEVYRLINLLLKKMKNDFFESEFNIEFNDGEYCFYGHFSLGQFFWHTCCEEILKIQFECMKLLEGMKEND